MSLLGYMYGSFGSVSLDQGMTLSSSIIIVKSTTIKEDYFKFLIPSKTKLKDFVNDPIKVSFASFSVDCPRHNSTTSSCHKRTKRFKSD
jgi:hypothetical protein